MNLLCTTCCAVKPHRPVETPRGVEDYACTCCGAITCGGCLFPESNCQCKPDDYCCDPE